MNHLTLNQKQALHYQEHGELVIVEPIKDKLSPSLNKISWQCDGWYQDEGNNVYFGKIEAPYKINQTYAVVEEVRHEYDWSDVPLVYLSDAQVKSVEVKKPDGQYVFVTKIERV